MDLAKFWALRVLLSLSVYVNGTHIVTQLHLLLGNNSACLVECDKSGVVKWLLQENMFITQTGTSWHGPDTSYFPQLHQGQQVFFLLCIHILILCFFFESRQGKVFLFACKCHTHSAVLHCRWEVGLTYGNMRLCVFLPWGPQQSSSIYLFMCFHITDLHTWHHLQGWPTIKLLPRSSLFHSEQILCRHSHTNGCQAWWLSEIYWLYVFFSFDHFL